MASTDEIIQEMFNKEPPTEQNSAQEIVQEWNDMDPLIFNNQIQTHDVLLKFMEDEIKTNFSENPKNLPNIDWVESVLRRLRPLRPLLNKVVQKAPDSDLAREYGDADTLLQVRFKDLKSGWGYSVNRIQFVFPLTSK